MEHDAHLAENVDSAGPKAKIITAIVILVALLGAGVYIVNYSGMWTVQKQTQQL